MKIAIMGASGFVGSNLIQYLLSNTNHNVLALCPNPEAMAEYTKFGARFSVQKSDVFDSNSVALFMTLPKWSKTLTQPIGLHDALLYLTAAVEVPIVKHEIGKSVVSCM